MRRWTGDATPRRVRRSPDAEVRFPVRRREPHHSAKQDGFTRRREVLEDLVRKDHELRAREDQMIQHLLRLRESGVVLRS